MIIWTVVLLTNYQREKQGKSDKGMNIIPKS